jgi:cysteine desulfurase
MVYLDYSATTPILPEVLDSYNKVTEEYFANTQSIHKLGIKSKELLDSATKQIAELLSIGEDEFDYTSGATEANNMAILGACEAYKRFGNRICVSEMEHPSIYGICKHLEEKGFIIDRVGVNQEGLIDLEELRRKVTPETILVSISAVNSETGARQPLGAIKQVIKKNNPNVLFHSDLTQAIGKVPVRIKDVDLASISGEKIYGPGGIGLLYHGAGIKIKPIQFGSHEGELKPGTRPLPLIVSFSKALRLALKDLDKKEKTVKQYQERIIEHLSSYPNVYINTSKYCIPHILNISVVGIKPETFIHALEQDEIYVSSNTACYSGRPSPSVMAMYKDEARSVSSIRISLSYLTLPSEVNMFIESFGRHYEELSKLK